MKITALQKDGFILMVVPEDITFQSWRSLQTQLNNALSMFEEQWMVLDFRKVGFINSSGIGVLVETLKSLRKRGGGLCLLRVQEPIKRLFKKTRLFEDFAIVDDESSVRYFIDAG